MRALGVAHHAWSIKESALHRVVREAVVVDELAE